LSLFQFKNKTILILSPEDWGKNLLSKHLYAKELSKNNRVYFLHTSPHPEQQEFITSTNINDQLILLHLKKVVKGIFKLPSFLVDFQNQIIIKKIKLLIDEPIDIVWSFDQSKFQNLKQFDARTSIFHPVDYIEKALPFLKKISNSASLVLSVSQKILDEIDTKTPKHFINHGLDESFTRDKNVSTPTPIFIQSEKINVGYIGNLLIKYLDWDNLIKTVKLNSETNFVFIGPNEQSNLGGSANKNLAILKSLPNTSFTGSLSKKELQNVLPFFDVFLLCYDHDKFPIQVSNSHKILEYLINGNVVVSSYISTYGNSKLLEMVVRNSDLPKKLSEVCKKLDYHNSPITRKERVNFAIENTYIKQIERIEKVINQ